MMMTGAQPVWAGQAFRLDPTRLPQKVSYAARDSLGEITITVDRRGAVLQRAAEGEHVGLTTALPKVAFRGVAVRAIDSGPDTTIVTMELLHEDEDLCVPLRVGHELADIARDWQLWSQVLDLPMLIIGLDNVARTLDQATPVVEMDEPQPRRHHSLFADRRPRFLARRRRGTLGVRLMVEGDEIIARG